MQRPTQKVADFAKSQERKDLNFAAKAAVDAMSTGTAALYLHLRTDISNAITWLVGHEVHADTCSYRNMVQAMIALCTSWSMVKAYSEAMGVSIPAPIQAQYELAHNYYEWFKFHDHSGAESE